MATDIERRIGPIGGLRADPDSPKLAGHAAVFDSLSEELWGFREKIAPGAFAESLSNKDDVRALFNHDPNFVLGRSTAKTLRMREDDIGLAVEIDPPDTQFARDLVTSVRRGDISQMSFAFSTLEDSWNYDDDEHVTRTLVRVKLFDVSPVTYPAYPDTDVGVRRLAEFKRISPRLLRARHQHAALI